ncbi:sulfatase-like hydrolase/transferase [Flavilitoribacter nigricans]|uniref:Sulfatase n=1 Tax=Flavilitoribacter nigricans (strain ATCC 23147 / DSM 23189 / NBRC 102662 / NCIMB 1420 / SS-2) TaxID=1122177 RepID=A0A2D0N334_FLAN2|nr:sulfatase-like hydrolase/transferase [Flavilitoribacter nigricans]PHN02808.1 sulfatase [Flavilitoribacter nigricans DSM 23189 = NBRC 102662]
MITFYSDNGKQYIFWLGLLLLTACNSTESVPEASTPPNIIWIIAEDISPAFACYGDSLAQTPNIDRLCREGIRFDNAYATAPICAPSRSCLVSGRYAISMGTQHLRSEIPFSPNLKTLPEVLRTGGYFTSNRNKTDYNFSPEGLWEHWSGSYAPWRQRTDDRPFFSFINVGPSHEGSVNRLASYEENVKELSAEQRIDPNRVNVPPYYPDTEASREVWAHYYDMLQVLDKNVGLILDSLETDGLLEETVIFFFGDHGFGMPRYKRWLYDTGLNVPLMVRIPEKYRHLQPDGMDNATDQLVSFVDFAPTVLNLAGLNIPETMEGQAFLGDRVPRERTYVFAARDRADDMFEMSRAVRNDRYLYIRHFMPHLPYMQSGFIYSDVKEGFRALREARAAGLNNELQESMWQAKPIEELYDLQEDPAELRNLADVAELQETKTELSGQLHQWMLDHRDLGLLTEAEYMIRSAGSTPYDYARTGDDYRVEEILETAEMVGRMGEEALVPLLQNADSGVRYWAVMGLIQLAELSPAAVSALQKLLADDSPSVRILAAEALSYAGDDPQAVQTLGELVADDRPWVALEAARSIQLIGEDARPLIPVLYQVLEKNLGQPDAPRKYKDFNYAAFTSWALEWALQEMGEDIKVN